jgi:hypothetical protein
LSCKDSKSNHFNELVQCESCSLTVHTHHLIDSQPTTTSNFISSCRPTFSESNTHETKDTNPFDQHYWLHIPNLTKPCSLCKRKTISSSLFGSGRPSTMPSPDAMTKPLTNKNPLPESSSPKLSGTSSGFQCLWCSRGYHRRCWEQVFNQEERTKCDYGLLR